MTFHELQQIHPDAAIKCDLDWLDDESERGDLCDALAKANILCTGPSRALWQAQQRLLEARRDAVDAAEGVQA